MPETTSTAETGGSAITSYSLEWDQGKNSTEFVSVIGVT